MPALRSSLRRLVLAALVCLAAVAPALRPSETSAAAACPISPPVPLRMLYKGSERVVVARAGNSEREKSETDDSYRRTTFHISESLKGGHGESTLQVVHYTSNNTPDYVGNFKKGDRLLLFLIPNEGNDAYWVYDMRYGAKKLSDEDLKIYLKRIEELSALLLKENPDEKEIVEWLVRCAEEPATRWEGAYELQAGFSIGRNEAAAAAAENKESEGEGEGEEAEEEEGEAEGDESEESEGQTSEAEAAEDPAAAAESEEVVETSLFPAAEEGEGGEAQQQIDIKYMRLGMYGTDITPESVAGLTPDQKKRLADALFSAVKIDEGETALLEVVKDWGDERLVPFLTNHLRGLEKDPPYLAAELMSTLAAALKDKALNKLVENYVENAPYEDYVEGEYEESEGSDDEGEDTESRERASAEEKKKVSAVEKRRELLREFLAAVENRIQYDLAMQLSR